MTTPIRRGTARRLGIDPPRSPEARAFQAMAKQSSTFALGLSKWSISAAEIEANWPAAIAGLKAALGGVTLGLTNDDEVTDG